MGETSALELELVIAKSCVRVKTTVNLLTWGLFCYLLIYFVFKKWRDTFNPSGGRGR